MSVPLPHIAALAPYAVADVPGLPVASLSQNESFRSASPVALEAAAKALQNAHLYPDPGWSALRQALADLHHIDKGLILCGNGSLDLIGCIARCFLNRCNAALAPAHAYPFFRTATSATGARLDTAPEQFGTVDISALLDAVKPDTQVVFVANPGNPTGTRISRQKLDDLRSGLPQHILLVIDEAYGEFADHLNKGCFDMVETGNTIVLRTFSKAYGLAGLRIGWGLFPSHLKDHISKLINPNAISVAGQAAALVALQEQDYMVETCKITSKRRDAFIRRLRNAGCNIGDSLTNFALARLESPDDARTVEAKLRHAGHLVRGQSGANLPSALRITIGDQPAMDQVADILERHLEGSA